ncbi:hypothetical protein [Phaeobacter sp. JH20_13]|uniref:hypothetical protein n=2 Tax=Phaeobacter TaxID=302485 RepID=UPI003A8768F2
MMGLYMETPFSQSGLKPTSTTETLNNNQIDGALLEICLLLAQQSALDFVQDADMLLAEDAE